MQELEEWLPPEVQSVLRHSQHLILYSLHPEVTTRHLEGEVFRGFPILKQVHVTDEDVRNQVVNALHESMTDPAAILAMCFIPHHGLRAVRGSLSVDLVICYHCGNMQVFLGDTRVDHWWQTSNISETLLDALLEGRESGR